MTIREAIDSAKSQRHGCVLSEKNAVRWLKNLDETIESEVHSSNEGPERNVDFNSYEASTVLLVPEPYSELYISYLCAQIDRSIGELNRYNNEINIFETAYRRYTAYYNRKYMPKGQNFKW